MSGREPGGDELDQALYALACIQEQTKEGRAEFDRQLVYRHALVAYWISVGSGLKQYCRRRNIKQGTCPFSDPIKMRDRLTYRSLTRVDADVLWRSSIEDAPSLAAVLSELEDEQASGPAS